LKEEQETEEMKRLEEDWKKDRDCKRIGTGRFS